MIHHSITNQCAATMMAAVVCDVRYIMYPLRSGRPTLAETWCSRGEAGVKFRNLNLVN